MHILAIIRAANHIKVDDDCLVNVPSRECSLGSLKSVADCCISEPTRAHRLAYDSFAHRFKAKSIEAKHAELAQFAPEGSVMELLENLEARKMWCQRLRPISSRERGFGERTTLSGTSFFGPSLPSFEHSS